EKERQRLESLRKKQEAEEQRKKKMEEEKRRRQAEMKQKREERLRKALQARERAEEEKKKRMEQKILQSDEKVRLSQGRDREEKAEERGRKKLSKKSGEADARKQKALKRVRAAPAPSCRVTGVFFLLQEEHELEQQEPLQKRRGDEVRGKGKKVLELKSLLEQQQAGHGKERYCLGSALRTGWATGRVSRSRNGVAEAPSGTGAALRSPLQEPSLLQAAPAQLSQPGSSPELLQPSQQLHGLPWTCSSSSTSLLCWVLSCGDVARGSGCLRGGPVPAASCSSRCCLCFQKSISAPYLKPLKGTKQSSQPKVSEDNYGMDQNSDDATDDENDPRKPVPAWADGPRLRQGIVQQYYHPVNTDQLFGLISGLRLEEIFGKSKPRYFKRTSSAVWHSPP
ncbi:INCEA protein, partial [Amazona guildingii]|nr:INCEA protein [Amazona guildingii]